jgi:DNA modification methylase
MASRSDLLDTLLKDLEGLQQPSKGLPRAAKDPATVDRITRIIRSTPTNHQIFVQDSRNAVLEPKSVHLAVTSPPYWTLKRYRDVEGQLGHVDDYGAFLTSLDQVWKRVFDALVPGGRLVCVVGDVCLSRRVHGRHRVVPLHASIQEHVREIGFDNLTPILWHKISNARHEVERGGGFLGKPYEPNAVIKNDVEFILMFRKPGGYRAPTVETRLLSLIPETEHRTWFQQVWTGIGGASTRSHPAPFPISLAERLIRMFSFVGDVVLDPFSGTATTSLAAAMWGRNSVGYEVDLSYAAASVERLVRETAALPASIDLIRPRPRDVFPSEAIPDEAAPELQGDVSAA